MRRTVQRIAVCNHNIIVLNIGKTLLHFAVGGNGLSALDSVAPLGGHGYIAVRIGYGGGHSGRADQGGQVAAVTQDNAPKNAAHPDIRRSAESALADIGGAFHGSTRIAFDNAASGTAYQAAHTEILITAVVTDIDLNVRHSRAVGDLHGGGANHSAHAAAAPAGICCLHIQDGIAGYCAVFEGTVSIVSGTGQAHQTAYRVPACGIPVDDLGVVVGVKHDVLHLGSGGGTEHTDALGIRINADIPNGIGLSVVAGGEEGHGCLGVSGISGVVIHTADGCVCPAGACGIQVVGLDPIEVQSGTGSIAVRVPFAVGQVGIAIIQVIVFASVRGRDIGRGIFRPVVPVDELQLLHGPYLIAVPLASGPGGTGGPGIPKVRLRNAVQAEGVGEEGGHRVGIHPGFGRVHAAVGVGHIGAVQRPGSVPVGLRIPVAVLPRHVQAVYPRPVSHKLILGHLDLQLPAGVGVLVSQLAVGGHQGGPLGVILRGRIGSGLVEVAVAIHGDHAAVVVGGTQGAAALHHFPIAGALEGQVIAGVAPLLILPVEHAEFAHILVLVGPGTEMHGLAVSRQAGGIGIGLPVGVAQVGIGSGAESVQLHVCQTLGIGDAASGGCPEGIFRGIQAVDLAPVGIGAAV